MRLIAGIWTLVLVSLVRTPLRAQTEPIRALEYELQSDKQSASAALISLCPQPRISTLSPIPRPNLMRRQ